MASSSSIPTLTSEDTGRCRPGCAGLCDDLGLRSAYAEHGAELVGFCRRLTADHGLAEDVVQEVFLRAWRRCGEYRPGLGTMRTWLFAIARNAVVDAARARRRRPVPALLDSDVHGDAGSAERPAAGDPWRDLDHVENRLELRRALDRLSDQHRSALVEVYLMDRSYADAAARLGVASGTLKSRLHYGVQALRIAMAQPEQ